MKNAGGRSERGIAVSRGARFATASLIACAWLAVGCFPNPDDLRSHGSSSGGATGSAGSTPGATGGGKAGAGGAAGGAGTLGATGGKTGAGGTTGLGGAGLG